MAGLQISEPDSSITKGGDAISGGPIGSKTFNFGANPNISALSNNYALPFLVAGIVGYFLVKKGVFK